MKKKGFPVSFKYRFRIQDTKKFNSKKQGQDYHQTKSFGIGGTISIGAKYDITKRFSILFLPRYNNFFTNINNDSATKIKPYNFNFSTGLQYRF